MIVTADDGGDNEVQLGLEKHDELETGEFTSASEKKYKKVSLSQTTKEEGASSGGCFRSGGKSFRIKATGLLEELDVDNDGEISAAELQSYVLNAQLNKQQNLFLRKSLRGMAAIIAIAALFIVGLTVCVVMLSKEVASEDGVLTDGQHNEISCPNPDITVNHGILQSTSLLDLAADSGPDGPALATRRSHQKRAIASTMPDKFFKELEWIEFTSTSGAEFSLKISGIVRIPSVKASCGSYLKLTTGAGILVFDDYDIYYDSGVVNLFAQGGFSELLAETSSSETRRLSSADNHLEMRKLQSSGVSVSGMFNFIDDLEWDCSSIEKPEMPAVCSMTSTITTLCENDGFDVCTYELMPGEMADSFGTSVVNGIRTIQSTREIFSEEKRSVMVTSLPYAPGYKYIEITDYANQTVTSYLLDSNDNPFHCSVSDVLSNETVLGLTDDMIFSYKGTTSFDEATNKSHRHFQILLHSENDTSSQQQYSFVDYYDDQDTHLPYKFDFPDQSVVFDDVLVGAAARVYDGYDITNNQELLYACRLATDEAVVNEDNSYPPAVSLILPASLSVEYYVQNYCPSAADDAWCAWAEPLYDAYVFSRPTSVPSSDPTSSSPSVVPTTMPSSQPSLDPTEQPSGQPSQSPTIPFPLWNQRHLSSFEGAEEDAQLAIKPGATADSVDIVVPSVVDKPVVDGGADAANDVSMNEALSDSSSSSLSSTVPYGNIDSIYPPTYMSPEEILQRDSEELKKRRKRFEDVMNDAINPTTPNSFSGSYYFHDINKQYHGLEAEDVGVFESGFNLTMARTCYMFCVSTYCDVVDDSTFGFSYTKNAIVLYNAGIKLQDGNVKVLVGYHDETIFVAFGGMKNMDHVRFTDDIALVDSVHCAGDDAQVHKTMQSSMVTIEAVLSPKLIEFMGTYPNSPVVVTGHGTGGGIATLFAAKFSSVSGYHPVLYTFGAPRVGNSPYVMCFQALVPTAYRVTFHGDTMLDAVFGEEYIHIPGEHFEDENGTWSVCAGANATHEDSSCSMMYFGESYIDAHVAYFDIPMSCTYLATGNDSVWIPLHVEEVSQPLLCLHNRVPSPPFCWMKTYGRGVGTIPNTCPEGYYYNSFLCYENCRDSYSPATQVDMFCYRDCPPGYVDTGLICHNPNSTLTGRDFDNPCPTTDFNQFYLGLCYHNDVNTNLLLKTHNAYTEPCPSGSKNVAGTCWKTCSGRVGFFIVKYPCVAMWLHQRAVTYSCDSGYSGPTLGICAARSQQMVCPTNYYNSGLLCQVKINTPVVDGEVYYGTGIDAMKPSYFRGAGISPSCADGEENDSGLCYEMCRDLYNSVGPVCWGNCPDPYVKCGAGCAASKLTCGMIVAEQVMNSLAVAAVPWTLGASSVATSAASAVGDLSQVEKIGVVTQIQGAVNKAIKESLRAPKIVTDSMGAILTKTRKVDQITSILGDAVTDVYNIVIDALDLQRRPKQIARMLAKGNRLAFLGNIENMNGAMVAWKTMKLYRETNKGVRAELRLISSAIDETVQLINEGSVETEQYDAIQHVVDGLAVLSTAGGLTPLAPLTAFIDLAISFTYPTCDSPWFYSFDERSEQQIRQDEICQESNTFQFEPSEYLRLFANDPFSTVGGAPSTEERINNIVPVFTADPNKVFFIKSIYVKDDNGNDMCVQMTGKSIGSLILAPCSATTTMQQFRYLQDRLLLTGVRRYRNTWNVVYLPAVQLGRNGEDDIFMAGKPVKQSRDTIVESILRDRDNQRWVSRPLSLSNSRNATQIQFGREGTSLCFEAMLDHDIYGQDCDVFQKRQLFTIVS